MEYVRLMPNNGLKMEMKDIYKLCVPNVPTTMDNLLLNIHAMIHHHHHHHRLDMIMKISIQI
jgi:hypothetical protein